MPEIQMRKDCPVLKFETVKEMAEFWSSLKGKAVAKKAVATRKKKAPKKRPTTKKGKWLPKPNQKTRAKFDLVTPLLDSKPLTATEILKKTKSKKGLPKSQPGMYPFLSALIKHKRVYVSSKVKGIRYYFHKRHTVRVARMLE